MKRIATFMALLCTVGALRAQQPLTLRQPLTKPFSSITIDDGWQVRIVADSSEYISIHTNSQYRDAVQEPLCTILRSTLQLKSNRSLPVATRVEIHTRGPLNRVVVGTGSSLEADRLQTGQLELASGAHGQVHHLSGDDDHLDLILHSHCHLEVDTLAGNEAEARLEPQSHFLCHHVMTSQPLQLHDNRLSKGTKLDKLQLPEGDSWFVAEQEAGTVVHAKEKRSFSLNLGLTASASVKQQMQVFNIDMPIFSSWKINDRWLMDYGILFRYSHMTTPTLADNNLPSNLNADPNAYGYTRDAFDCNYIGARVSVARYILEPRASNPNSIFRGAAIGFDAALLRGYQESLMHYFHGASFAIPNEQQTLNPWKIEVGVSFHLPYIPILNNLRIYTDLLPDFSPATNAQRGNRKMNIGLQVGL